LTRIAKHALYLILCLSIWSFKSKGNENSAVLNIQNKNDSMVCDSLFCFAKQYITNLIVTAQKPQNVLIAAD
jgi:hypothetical protein